MDLRWGARARPGDWMCISYSGGPRHSSCQMPGTSIERIEHISAVIERDFSDGRLFPCELELVRRQRIMKMPHLLELFEPLARCDANACAGGEQLFVRRHRRRMCDRAC